MCGKIRCFNISVSILGAPHNFTASVPCTVPFEYSAHPTSVQPLHPGHPLHLTCLAVHVCKCLLYHLNIQRTPQVYSQCTPEIPCNTCLVRSWLQVLTVPLVHQYNSCTPQVYSQCTPDITCTTCLVRSCMQVLTVEHINRCTPQVYSQCTPDIPCTSQFLSVHVCNHLFYVALHILGHFWKVETGKHTSNLQILQYCLFELST